MEEKKKEIEVEKFNKFIRFNLLFCRIFFVKFYFIEKRNKKHLKKICARESF